MKVSQEIARPPIEAEFTVLRSRQIISPLAVIEGIGRQAKEHWKMTATALGLLTLTGGVMGSTVALQTEPGQEVLQFGSNAWNYGFVSALQRRSEQMHAKFDQKCANNEGTPIMINSADGDVNVRSRPSTTSPAIKQFGNGLTYSVGEVEHFMVVCADDQTAGYIATKYTVKP